MEINSEPQSEVTCTRTPCLENTSWTKSFARVTESTVSVVGMNMDCLDNLLTTTRMAVKPEDSGRCSMKSIKMESQGHDGMGSCLIRP